MRFLFIVLIVLLTTHFSFSQELSYNADQYGIEGYKAGQYLEDKFSEAIYKQVDFSEFYLGQNTLTRASAFMGTDELSSSWPGGDSTDIMGSDTVWKYWQLSVSRSSEVVWHGMMKLNGTNYDADTATYVRLSYYIKHSPNFYWSNGGKRLGLFGDDIDNDATGVPEGGVWAEGFPPDCGYPVYEDDCGFSALRGFDGPNHDGTKTMGIYRYYHNMYFNSCSNLSYGNGWYMAGDFADDDRTLPILEDVDTNVPPMPTPNTD